MNNQKDNNIERSQNNTINMYNHDNLSNYYNVLDHDIYKNLAERSQKIVTALYMLTDFLDRDDALRKLIRDQITEVMHNLFMLTHSSKKDRVETLSGSHNTLFSIISYLEVVYQNGFISKMNHHIVIEQIRALRNDIDLQIKKSLPYDKKYNQNRAVKDFSFSESFFNNSKTSQRANHSTTEGAGGIEKIKDTKNASPVSKKTIDSQPLPMTPLSDKVTKNNTMNSISETKVVKKKNHAKESRKDNILKILKQKRNASINDICALFKNCSSKTIQRDLADLIDEGMVIKEGSRRWSKYNLNY